MSLDQGQTVFLFMYLSLRAIGYYTLFFLLLKFKKGQTSFGRIMSIVEILYAKDF